MYEQHQQNHQRHYSDNNGFPMPSAQQDDLSMSYSQFVFDDQTLAALDSQDLDMKYMQLLESSSSDLGSASTQLPCGDNEMMPNALHNQQSFAPVQHQEQYTLDQSTDFYSLDHARMMQYEDPFPQQLQHFDQPTPPQAFYPFSNGSSDAMFQPPFPPTEHFTSAAMPMRHHHHHHHHHQPHPSMGPSSIASSSSNSSLSSSSSFAHAEQRPQIYVRKACVSCKQSHVACDVQRPCSRCVRLNKSDTCVDAERKKRGRPCGSGKKKREAAAAAAVAAAAAAASMGDGSML